jgi:molybdopterin-guanine dinucleotide biosynthesis protein A
VTGPPRIAGLILAGGRSSRFPGGEKEGALLLGAPLIAHVIARARPQVATLAVSRAARGQAGLGLEIVVDLVPDSGPLAGLHAGLVWATALTPPATHMATFACDMPLAPTDIVSRLIDAAGAAPASVASCAGVLQPTLGVWSVSLVAAAAARLAKGSRSLHGFVDSAGAAIVEFPQSEADAFVNVNTAADLAAVAALLAARRSG